MIEVHGVGSIEELPLKTTVYGTLVGLLNTHSPDFVEAVRAAKSALPTVAPIAAFCADDSATAFDAAYPGTFKSSLRRGTVRSNVLASECALVDPARCTTVDALPPLPLHSNLGILCVLQLLQRVIERLEQYLAANNATKVKLIVRCPYRTAAIRTLQQQVQCEIAH